MRKLVEFGTVVNGNKGYFVDYAASIDEFSKYLPVASPDTLCIDNKLEHIVARSSTGAKIYILLIPLLM
jgi:hypothetical protein